MTKEQTDKLNLNSPEGRMFNAAMAILTTEYKPNETFGFMFDKVQALADQLPTPTPPEEPSGVEEKITVEEMAKRRYTEYDVFYRASRTAFIEGAKWQSTHNTLEWPSEGQFLDVADLAAKEEHGTNEAWEPDRQIFKSGAIWAIQWLKSILNK